MDARTLVAIILAIGFLIFMTGVTTMLIGPTLVVGLPSLTGDTAATLLQTLKEIMLFVLGTLAAFLTGRSDLKPGATTGGGGEVVGVDTIVCERCETQFRDPRDMPGDPVSCPRCGHDGWRLKSDSESERTER